MEEYQGMRVITSLPPAFKTLLAKIPQSDGAVQGLFVPKKALQTLGIDTEVQPNYCKICAKVFDSFIGLAKHAQIVHNEFPNDDINGSSFEKMEQDDQLDQPNGLEEGQKELVVEYKCTKCGETTSEDPPSKKHWCPWNFAKIDCPVGLCIWEPI